MIYGPNLALCRYLKEAIKNSPHYTENLDSADIVYVDDYCYSIW